MSLQARTLGLVLEFDDALRGILALGLLEAEGLEAGPLPPEFEKTLAALRRYRPPGRGGR